MPKVELHCHGSLVLSLKEASPNRNKGLNGFSRSICKKFRRTSALPDQCFQSAEFVGGWPVTVAPAASRSFEPGTLKRLEGVS